MVSKVAYVMEVPPDQRDFRRYGMEFFASKGARILIADVTPFIRPNFVEKRNLPDSFPQTEIRKYSHWAQLADLRLFIRDADFIIMQAGDAGTWQTTLLYRALSKAGKPYLIMSTNAHPTGNFLAATDSSGGWQRKWKDWREGKIKPLNSLLRRIPRNWLGIRPADFAIYGGLKSVGWSKLYPVGANTRKIFAHAMDYDIFRFATSPREFSQPIAVYMDEWMCFKRDMAFFGVKQPELEYFYPRLRRLFERIEETFGLKVVIAANPRADYKGRENLFGNREIYYQSTAALVASSSLVVGHCSTSLGYAVMANKPIFMCSQEEIYQSWVDRKAYDGFSRALNKNIEMFDDPEKTNFSQAMEIDHGLYRAFMEDYVKIKTSPDIPFWEIVLQQINRELAHG